MLNKLLTVLITKLLEKVFNLLWEYIDRKIQENRTRREIEEANETGNTSDLETSINDLLN